MLTTLYPHFRAGKSRFVAGQIVIFAFMEIDFENNFQLKDLNPKTEFDQKVIDFLHDWFSEHKTVEVQTSGSTGVPKKFQIEKARMLNSAKLTCDFLDLKPGNSALVCLPVEYISGKMMVVRSILRKLKLTTVTPSTQPLENLTKTFDFVAMTPLQVEYSISKIELIEKLIIGGAAVSEVLKSRLKGKKTKIFETYGMSETLSHIALKEINPNEEEFFTVFDDVRISTDDRGCLQIDAPRLNPKSLQTNDVVEIKNGNQFKFLGRSDNIINSGGAKIFPESLEKLVKHSIYNELVFIGLKDNLFGQRLVMAIEESSGSEFEICFKKEDSVVPERQNLWDKIAEISFEKSFHRPKEIIFLKKIPRTPNGKVNRLKLLEICSDEKITRSL